MSETPRTAEPDALPGNRDLAVRLAIASAIGVLVGVVVLLLEHAVDDVLEEIFEAPVWVPAGVVAAGALVTALVTRHLSGGGTATTEVYVREFHRDEPELEPKHAPGRLLAALPVRQHGQADGAALAFSGDARLLAAATRAIGTDGELARSGVRIWDLAELPLPVELLGHPLRRTLQELTGQSAPRDAGTAVSELLR